MFTQCFHGLLLIMGLVTIGYSGFSTSFCVSSVESFFICVRLNKVAGAVISGMAFVTAFLGAPCAWIVSNPASLSMSVSLMPQCSFFEGITVPHHLDLYTFSHD